MVCGGVFFFSSPDKNCPVGDFWTCKILGVRK